MKQQLEHFLHTIGYDRITSSLPEFTMYFKLERTFGNVIYVIEDQKGLYINKDQYNHMKEKAIAFYQENGIQTIHMLSLILTNDMEKAKRIGGEDIFCWTIDTRNRQLVCYENQVADFYGMRGALEGFLFSYEEWNRKDREYRVEEELKQEKEEWKDKPCVNTVIIGINMVVFMICTYTGELLYNIGALESNKIIYQGQIYRFLTALFLHVDINHLFSNLIMLYFAGCMMERIIGHLRYGIVYLAAGLGGSALSFFSQVMLGQSSSSVGASGAIFGIIGALLFQVIIHKGRVQEVTTGRVIFLICYSLYSGFVATNIDNAGHIGGLLAGFFIMAGIYQIDKIRQQKRIKQEKPRVS